MPDVRDLISKMEKLVRGCQGSASSAASSDEVRVLRKVVLVPPQFRKVSDLVWPEEFAEIQQRPQTKLEQTDTVAAFIPKLALPAGCQEDLGRLLVGLAADPRKQHDVRDLRVVGLKAPEAAARLKIQDHPDCGVLQLALAFKFVQGRVQDMVLEPSALNEALLGILASNGVLQEACHIHWERTTVQIREPGRLRVTIRTESAESAEALKQALQTCMLEKKLQEMKIEEFVRTASATTSVQLAYESGRLDSHRSDVAYFQFSLEEIRCIGGRILDIIDPSRASIDPMFCEETLFPSEKPSQEAGLPVAWPIPSRIARGRHVNSAPPSAGAPRWIPTALEPAPFDGLRLASEVSGIPWTGPRTLTNPLYQRLGELLTAMRPLFAQLAPEDGTFGLHQPLDARSKVLIKAQVYEVGSGQEILGELHREGISRDQIQMVGLYYPLVDDGLAGGDLEITAVLTGGCGSQYPKSKTINVQAGTAIAFDNGKAYHRMTALRTACTSSSPRGRRLVVAFFVLCDLEPPGLPCTDRICVNYSDKARVMVRRHLGMLPKHIQLNIEQFLTGGISYTQQRFESSRQVRARDVSQEGLTFRTMD